MIKIRKLIKKKSVNYCVSRRKEKIFMKNKKIPIFKSIVEEANFWDSHDVTDYLSDMKRVDVEFVPHTPKEDTIVIRVHSGIKRRLEQLAANQGLGLSTLIRTWFIEKIKQEAQRL